MIGAPTVQAFEGTAKDGYDAGYFAAKSGKPYDFSSNHTAKYKLGYDFGYRDVVCSIIILDTLDSDDATQQVMA